MAPATPRPGNGKPRAKKTTTRRKAAPDEPIAETPVEASPPAAPAAPVAAEPPAPETVAEAAPPSRPASGERLHKFLASTGAGSRRECETFIAQGRVSVNGKVVTKMGVKVDPATDRVTLDGEPVRQEEKVYYLLHKPVGFISTSSDERGRPRVLDLVRDRRHRIYTVGRLDADSTGLILLTNDGEIANVVCHPRYRIEKTYQVTLRGEVTREALAKIEAGVWLAEGRSSPARLRPVGHNPRRGESYLEMTLFEGRNREIRRVFARVGLKVKRLHRVRLGPLSLGDLPPGVYRDLRPEELAFVQEAELLYLANKEAWDAELPPEKRRGPSGPPRFRRPKGRGPRRDRFEGPRGPRGPARRDDRGSRPWHDRPPRRDDRGFGGPPREGGGRYHGGRRGEGPSRPERSWDRPADRPGERDRRSAPRDPGEFL
jgi:pseudouridine synthase